MVPGLKAIFNKFNLKPIATLITHGHLDHTFSVLPFSQEYGVPTYIQSRDRRLLANPYLALGAQSTTQSLMQQFGLSEFSEPADLREFAGGESFDLAGFTIKTIHAPGHTAGSAMFVVNDEYLISGDVLFHNGIGRTDLPTGSQSVMANTLVEEILSLDDALNVLPGHGPVTTIGRERKQSPYLKPEYLDSMRKGSKRG